MPELSSKTPPSHHFEFLDGIRGLMAVYVCLFHIREESVKSLSEGGRLLSLPLHFGHAAVCVFIVLSGFVLMAPVARSDNPLGQIPGGLLPYFLRRARRILPPYYAAFAMTFLMGILSPEGFKALRQFDLPVLQRLLFTENSAWHYAIPHLLLINNWGEQWQTLDYPLWSVALEWQLYFFFPLVFLPLLQKIKITTLILLVLLVSVLPASLLPYNYSGMWTFPWLAALFCLGMLGALACFSPQLIPSSGKIFLLSSNRTISLLAAITIGLIFAADQPNLYRISWIADLSIGITTIIFIIKNLKNTKKTKAIQLLTNPSILYLGSISYSIYLIHKLVLIKLGGIFKHLTNHYIIHDDIFFLLFITVGTTTVIVISHLFHIAFERPFMKKKSIK